LLAIAILLMRHWLLPNIEQHHEKIVVALSTAIGNPVVIAEIEGDWQGFRPHLSLTDVHILDDQGQSVLILPKVTGSVSWLSFLFAEPRLDNLQIDRPELLIRRDVEGNISVAGIALLTEEGDSQLADWLLRQSRMVVRDALIIWLDEQRDAEPLMLRQVNFLVENWFGRHQVALRAEPPQLVSMPFEVRGDFVGDSFAEVAAWSGQVFAQLNYTDVIAWRPWLDLPQAFSRGRGGLRGWLEITRGDVTQGTLDLDLHDVITQLADDLPEMALRNMSGRVAWEGSESVQKVSTHQLEMQLQDGTKLGPTDLYFFADSNPQRAAKQIRANQMQLESLVSVAKFLPLPADFQQQLNRYLPSGKVTNLNLQWYGASDQPESFSVKGSFENMEIRQVGRSPGISGLTLEIDGSNQGGQIIFNSTSLLVDAPEIMPDPLSFETLKGQLTWQHQDGELLVNVDKVAVVNRELSGELSGSYQTRSDTKGVLDLEAKLTRGDIRYASRYVPLVALGRKGNDWLKGAIQGGHTENLRILIQGNLSDFPLNGTEDATFEISGNMQDGILEFDSAWPKIKNITGELSIQGNTLQVKSSSATMLGANLQDVTVSLPDMTNSDLMLGVKGQAQAASNTFLAFIQQSPVRGYINEFTDGITATGNAHLELDANIPLFGEKSLKISGVVEVRNNDINLGGGTPILRKTNGILTFTEAGMHAEGVKSQILGGAAAIDLTSNSDGVVQATATGQTNFDVLRQSNTHPLLNYVRGGTAWKANLSVAKKSAKLVVTSNLQGMESILPAPFAKQANEKFSLRFEKKNIDAKHDVIKARIGKLIDAKFERSHQAGVMEITRGMIGLNQRVRKLRREGLWIRGTLPTLALEEWGAVAAVMDDGGSAFPLPGVNMTIAKVKGYGLDVEDLNISTLDSTDAYSVKLLGDTLSGNVDWQARGDGKLTANLDKLYWQYGEFKKSDESEQSTTIVPGDLPALQVSIKDFQVDGKRIGKFGVVGHPEEDNWRLRRLNINNPGGSLVGSGIWHGGQQAIKTELDLILQINDSGNILDRSGYPNTVKNGAGTLNAKLTWLGQPHEFNYATLDGTLQLKTEKGRFVKMDPGVGKLLSVLSLQALPKRLTLDFNDVFSEGFQFDSIESDAKIQGGVLTTQNLEISGSSAKVTMVGNVDFNHETQDLHVKVLPTLGDSVSLLSAFAAGPLVGVGTLIVNKILGNPLDKLVSFEYHVSGTWDDPNVVKVGQDPVKN